jgi:hypothetical protein
VCTATCDIATASCFPDGGTSDTAGRLRLPAATRQT